MSDPPPDDEGVVRVGSTPPHSLEAEKAALGAVLVKPSAIDDLGALDVDDFFLPAHREIFEAMRDLRRAGKPYDVVTLADELRTRGLLNKLPDGMVYLSVLADSVGHGENARHYAGIVLAHATRRRLIAACAQIASSARGPEDPSELVAEARSQFAAIELRGASATMRIGDDYERVLDAMDKRGVAASRPDGKAVTTGLTKLDAILGVLRPDNLIAVGANPGRGKSGWALGVALHNALRKQIPVLIFSMEMSRAQLIERAIAWETSINSRLVSAGRMDKAQWHAVDNSRIRDVPVWINDERMTIARLAGETRAWRARRRRERLAAGMSADEAELALVVVDYLQLIEVNEGDDQKRYQAVGKASRELKMLSKERDANLPIIECVQLNRENMRGTKDGKPREPTPADLRESGNIEQDADIILFPWWEGDPLPHGRHPAIILVKKNRGGPQARAKCDWEPEFVRFSDRVEDPDGRLPVEDDDGAPDAR